MSKNMKTVLNLPYLFKRCIRDYETTKALASTCRSFYNIVHRQQIELRVDRKDSTPISLLFYFSNNQKHIEKGLMNELAFNSLILCDRHSDSDINNISSIKSVNVCLNVLDFSYLKDGVTGHELMNSHLSFFTQEIKKFPNLESICFEKFFFCSLISNNDFFSKCLNNIKSRKLEKLTGITYDVFLSFIRRKTNYFIQNLPNLKGIEIICNEMSNVEERDAKLLELFSKALGNCKINFVMKNIFYGYPKWSFYRALGYLDSTNEDLNERSFNKGSLKWCDNRDDNVLNTKLRIYQIVFELVMKLKKQNVPTNIFGCPIINGSYFLFNDNLQMGRYSFLQHICFTINYECTAEAFSRMTKNIRLFEHLKGFEVIFNSFGEPHIFNAYKKLLLGASDKIKLLKVRRCPFVDKEFATKLATRYFNLKCIAIGFHDRATTLVPIDYFADFKELDAIFVDFCRNTWVIPPKVRLFVIECGENEEMNTHKFYDQDNAEVQLRNRFLVVDKEKRGGFYNFNESNENKIYQVVYCYTILDWKLFEDLDTFNLSCKQTPEYCFV